MSLSLSLCRARRPSSSHANAGSPSLRTMERRWGSWCPPTSSPRNFHETGAWNSPKWRWTTPWRVRCEHTQTINTFCIHTHINRTEVYVTLLCPPPPSCSSCSSSQLSQVPLLSLSESLYASGTKQGWKMAIFILFSANCTEIDPRVCVSVVHVPHYSSHVRRVSDDGRWVRRRHRCQCLPHHLRGPGGHRGEEAPKVRDKRQQVWTRICKKAFCQTIRT